MDIIKPQPKKSYIRVLFKNKMFLMLRRRQMNDICERRSVLWKGMQVTKNEHTIIGTPVITFSKPCSLYTQQYHQREHLIRHSLISYYSPKPYFVEQRFYEMKRALLFVGMGNKMHFWILIFESSWNVNLSAYIHNEAFKGVDWILGW